MKRFLLTLGLAVVAAGVVSAQKLPLRNFEAGTYDRVTEFGSYLTGKTFDNTFIGVAGGVNLYHYKIEGSKKPGMGDRLAPALDVYAGKWVTPVWGLRVNYNGLKQKGLKTLVPNGDDKLHDLNFMYLRGDLMFNLSNAVGGYREDRFWNLVPYVGAGYARLYDKDKNFVDTHKMAATAGLLNTFRLGHRVDLTLEGRLTVTDRAFDAIPAGSRFDRMYAVTAGLQLKLGRERGFKRPVYVKPVDVKAYETRIATLEGAASRDRALIDRLTRELNATKNRPVEKVASPVAEYTYFELGKSTVVQSQMANLESIAEVIKANPDRKFNVTGYADAGTGSKVLNQRLSEKRAQNVADVLVTKYGVNRTQLVVSGKGGVAKHPSIPVLDRVVVTQ